MKTPNVRVHCGFAHLFWFLSAIYVAIPLSHEGEPEKQKGKKKK